jgi:hypothetical protein
VSQQTGGVRGRGHDAFPKGLNGGVRVSRQARAEKIAGGVHRTRGSEKQNHSLASYLHLPLVPSTSSRNVQLTGERQLVPESVSGAARDDDATFLHCSRSRSRKIPISGLDDALLLLMIILMYAPGSTGEVSFALTATGVSIHYHASVLALGISIVPIAPLS